MVRSVLLYLYIVFTDGADFCSDSCGNSIFENAVRSTCSPDRIRDIKFYSSFLKKHLHKSVVSQLNPIEHE